MRQIWQVAAGEWRYWLRSYLALGGVLMFVVLVVATSITTASRMHAESHLRAHQQTQAEETFLAQPSRHPHRMVHYGHYVFRAPAPLALFDPGLDSVTGQSIFLEGHRQNTVMFAEAAASADFGGLAWLTPALIYQLFAPLIIILLGHGAITREREALILAPLLALGISGRALLLGKTLALVLFIGLLLVPLIINCALALAGGAKILAVFLILALYFIYLVVWALICVCVSALLRRRSAALALLAGLWFSFTLVVPAIAVNVATSVKPLNGKIATDLAMRADIRQLGDGHNANDPAFKALKARLLAQYNVERVEDLPVNFRGLVAMEGEQKLTKVLNKYAQQTMDSQKQQETIIGQFSAFTPTLAIVLGSQAIAGTDLNHYHRFQTEAEALRFDFVQGLNKAHVQKLSYDDDINRNKDEASWQRARVDAANWQVLDAYHFKTANLRSRMSHGFMAIAFLLAWCAAMFGALLWCGKRLKP